MNLKIHIELKFKKVPSKFLHLIRVILKQKLLAKVATIFSALNVF